MPVTQLLLIRHAHTDPGPALCGCLDVGLSDRGWQHVAELTERAPTVESPAALYTSPLLRARVVAEALTERWRIDAQCANALREIECGVLEGVPFSDVQRAYPEIWARNLAQDDEDFRWPGGETYREFRARILDGLGDIAARHPAQRVAIVTHAGVISQVLGALYARPAAQWEPDRPEPLSATEVVWNCRTPLAVLTYNARDWY
jgi:broad specificity phosphatase PhoE